MVNPKSRSFEGIHSQCQAKWDQKEKEAQKDGWLKDACLYRSIESNKKGHGRL
jgi:hypothetical protein